KYLYYLSGPIGAGKTTALNYFGSLKTYEEWVEERHPNLGLSWKELNPDEQAALDIWIAHQFDLRNYTLLSEQIGVLVCDRTPLDPLAFTLQEEMSKKANFLCEHLNPGESKREIHSGQIILLV